MEPNLTRRVRNLTILQEITMTTITENQVQKRSIILQDIELLDNFNISFIVSNESGGLPIVINGKPLYKQNTTDTPNIKPGRVTVWYDTTNNCYYYVDADVEKVYRYMGDVTTEASLPTQKQAIGDTYKITSKKKYVFWKGSAWDDLGGVVELTGDVTSNVDGETTIEDNVVTNKKLRDSGPLSVIGRSANSTGDPGDITAGTDGHVLRRSGTGLSFGQVQTAGISNDAVTNAKLANMAANRIKGAVTAGDPVDLTPAQAITILGIKPTYAQASAPADTNAIWIDTTNNLTKWHNGTKWVATNDDAVTNEKLANMAANRIKGTVAAGNPVDLTAAQVITLLGIKPTYAQASAPSDVNAIWIDTTNNLTKWHNGTKWVATNAVWG